MLAYQADQDMVCQGCGNPLDESMDPANEGHYRAEMIRCFGCKAKGLAEQDFAESPHNVRPGAYWTAKLPDGG